MAYELRKPCLDVQKADFITKYNHGLGFEIKETKDAFFALEKNEKMEKDVPVLNEEYEQEQLAERRRIFSKNFFRTKSGWVRRKIIIENTYKDFFTDILMQIKCALDMGIEVNFPVYKEPDFSLEQTEEYHKTLRTIIPVTQDFVKECLQISLSIIEKQEEK